tara:strand:+ start:735 stop:986 length:252 start_codon:yes stop_codon:yes gene_type:complete
MTNTVTVNETKNTVSVNETTNQVTVTQGATQIVDVVSQGPQGPSGMDAGGLPTGGDPNNILIKSSYSNYDTSWSSSLDGGTFN